MIAIAGSLLTIIWPLWITAAALRIIKNGPDRDLALPTPFILLPVLRAQLAPGVPYPMFLVSVVGLFVLLYGCWQQKRSLARWATMGCGGAAVCMQLSTMLADTN